MKSPRENSGLAKLVKELRQQRAWSQQQLAEVAGVDIRTIQRLEKDGRAAPETLMAIAQAFDTDVKQLKIEAAAMEAGSKMRYIHLIPRLVSGADLTAAVTNSDRMQFEHDDDDDPRSIGAMKGVLELVKADVIRLYDASPDDRVGIEAELSREFQKMEGVGYYLFGVKRVIPNVWHGEKKLIRLATIFMSHCRSPKIVRDGALMVVPALLTEEGSWDPKEK